MTVSPSDASLPFRDPAWVVDAEMRVISCSDAAEGALGMARRDMTGRPLRDLIADGHVLGPLLEAAAGNGAAGPVAATLRSAREARPSAVRALALGSGAAGCLLVVASHETWESPEQAQPTDEPDRTVGDASTGLSQAQHLTCHRQHFSSSHVTVLVRVSLNALRADCAQPCLARWANGIPAAREAEYLGA